MSGFALNLPINNLSFGQVSVAILREIYALGHQPAVFPIGPVDTSSQNLPPEFVHWLNSCMAKAIATHSRKVPTLKLWHLQDSLASYSDRQVLFSFYELDSPTREEVNTAKNNSVVVFSSKWARDVFRDQGLTNVEAVPLGFDSHNFVPTNKKYFEDGRITFLLMGKYEHRKHHKKVIQAWIKRFEGDKKYFLECALYNHFHSPDEHRAFFAECVGHKRVPQVNFHPYFPTNNQFSDFLNMGDIVLDLSGAECFSLPSFQAVALGKHGVILNATGMKEWATAENSVLVEPNGKIPAYDGKFFHPGYPYNQGGIFDWAEEDFLAGCETAISRCEANRSNVAGLKLQTDFTYAKTVEALLEILTTI